MDPFDPFKRWSTAHREEPSTSESAPTFFLCAGLAISVPIASASAIATLAIVVALALPASGHVVARLLAAAMLTTVVFALATCTTVRLVIELSERFRR